MAISQNEYISNGSNNTFTLSGTPLSKSHIKVYYQHNGSDIVLLDEEYDLLENIVIIKKPIPAGDKIIINVSSDGSGLDMPPSKLDTIYSSIDEIIINAENISSINTVSDNIDSVNNVNNKTNEIVELSNRKEKIDELYIRKNKIDELEDRKNKIDTLFDVKDKIDNLSSISDNIVSVSNVSNNINSIVSYSNDIKKIGENISDYNDSGVVTNINLKPDDLLRNDILDEDVYVRGIIIKKDTRQNIIQEHYSDSIPRYKNIKTLQDLIDELNNYSWLYSNVKLKYGFTTSGYKVAILNYNVGNRILITFKVKDSISFLEFDGSNGVIVDFKGAVNILSDNIDDVKQVSSNILDIVSMKSGIVAIGDDLSNKYSHIDDYGSITEDVKSENVGTSRIEEVYNRLDSITTLYNIRAKIDTLTKKLQPILNVSDDLDNTTSYVIDNGSISIYASIIDDKGGIGASVDIVEDYQYITDTVYNIEGDIIDNGSILAYISDIDDKGGINESVDIVEDYLFLVDTVDNVNSAIKVLAENLEAIVSIYQNLEVLNWLYNNRENVLDFGTI